MPTIDDLYITTDDRFKRYHTHAGNHIRTPHTKMMTDHADVDTHV